MWHLNKANFYYHKQIFTITHVLLFHALVLVTQRQRVGF